ncbi:hypothetical protein MT325_m398R [Paramecium bursaria chlorella virus MT325]|uniref:Uncharacterized protein m398R n=1 Tax=Paramecium bursaria Chlorella virus MT325 TaxID=346932 RepID=A7IUC8_PBCVM|nr:hypothetical protein MT325_m398R [Paramecium bursaria chlorella virus MT325]
MTAKKLFHKLFTMAMFTSLTIRSLMITRSSTTTASTSRLPCQISQQCRRCMTYSINQSSSVKYAGRILNRYLLFCSGIHVEYAPTRSLSNTILTRMLLYTKILSLERTPQKT